MDWMSGAVGQNQEQNRAGLKPGPYIEPQTHSLKHARTQTKNRTHKNSGCGTQ